MIATLLSVASLCAVAPPVNSSEAPQTLLYVRTMPSGAQILLDGKPLGNSDGLFPVQPGQYQIVVDLEGHQPQKQDITVRDGRITRIELTLAKRPAAGSATPNSKPGKASDLSSGVSFGPWTGVPLKDRGEGLDEVFDFDTGKWGTMKSTGRIEGNTSREMRERGMDLLVRRLKESPPSMGKPEVWLFDAVRWEDPDGSSIPTPKAIPVLMRLKPETSSLRVVGPGRTYYYYFKTREGAMGLLYLIGGKGMDFPTIRYRLVQTTDTQSPGLAPAPAVAGFGPTIERVVSDDRSGKDWFIDLDKGVLYTPPADVDKQRKPQEMLEWARREGIDASGVKASQGVLLGIDLQVAAIDGASWDDVDPARVASAMYDEPHTSVKDAKDQPPVMVGGTGRGASALYGFRTREGGMGVLQVIGVTDDGKGLKIRYKLVHGVPVEITNSIGMKMVLIPAGEFMMGSGESAEETAAFFNIHGDNILTAFLKSEHPQHRVRITKPFYLGTYHVTRGQFRQFVKDSGYKTDAEKGDVYVPPGAFGWDPEKKSFYHIKDYSWRKPGFEQTDEHPVVKVTWNDAVAFCEWLSRKEGKTYRLPTEAEWEYACRAGTTTRYHSGDDPETLAKVANVADATAKAKFPDMGWAIKASDGYVFTAPVGQFKPNAFGLYDMHGNAWQWCADWCGADYYGKSPVDDPTGPDSGTVRVLRGGSWYIGLVFTRSADRYRGVPGSRFIVDAGFRVAMTP